MTHSEKTLKLVKFGRFTFDQKNRILRSRSRSIHLRPLAVQMLGILLDNDNSVVTHEELRKKLWGDRVVEYEMGLHTLAQELRSALADDARNPRFIRTLARRGYSFCAPVEPLFPANAAIHRGLDHAKWFFGGVLVFPGFLLILCLYWGLP